jgi:hypothetical protein
LERVPVVLALTPVAERAIEHVVFGRDALVEAVASAGDADELENEVASSTAESVLLSPDLSGLTAAHCVRVRARGVRLAGLARDVRERRQLHTLGVDAIVEPEDSEQSFLAALRSLQGPAPEPREPVEPPVTESDTGGAVVAVIGSKGSPGASECAASVAALAAERWRCVLVELDALGGGLDLRLGADPWQGSLLGFTRAVEAGDDGLDELLERWLAVRAGWPPALVGPPDPVRALAELARPGVAAAVLRALSSLYPLVVADVGSLLAEGQDAGPACRLHREVVVAADAVLLVFGAREEQVRAGLDQLDTLLTLGIAPERLRVAVSGVGGPAATPRMQLERVVLSQLAERRFAPDAWLPWDGRALTRAQRTGFPLARARRRGAYARALARLLEELFLPLVPAPRERKLRLLPPRSDAREPERVAVS